MTWRFWEELTSADLAALDVRQTVVLLPVAATEQHGPHLPLATDALIADAICARARDHAPGTGPVLQLSTQRLGLSPEHASFAGTLSLSPQTMLGLLTEIGFAVAASGFLRLIILNTHGGQTAIVDLVAQRLRRDAGMLVTRVNSHRLIADFDGLTERERRYGWHGGQVETSLMLRIAPALVRRDAVKTFASRAEAIDNSSAILRVEGTVGLGWLTEDLNPEGALGDATLASAALGERLLTILGQRLAALIEDVRRLAWPPAAEQGPGRSR
jgi:creatinine amidohydrolase